MCHADVSVTATSAGLKGFSSDSPKNSAERNTKTMTKFAIVGWPAAQAAGDWPLCSYQVDSRLLGNWEI
jgi:hypothetical protein